MSGDLKSEGLTTEVDLTFLFFKSESARFDFLHPEVDPGIQVLHPKVDLGIQVLHPEVDLGIQILHSEVDLGISEAAGNHVTSGTEGVVGGKREAAQHSLWLLLALLGGTRSLCSSGK